MSDPKIEQPGGPTLPPSKPRPETVAVTPLPTDYRPDPTERYVPLPTRAEPKAAAQPPAKQAPKKGLPFGRRSAGKKVKGAPVAEAERSTAEHPSAAGSISGSTSGSPATSTGSGSVAGGSVGSVASAGFSTADDGYEAPVGIPEPVGPAVHSIASKHAVDHPPLRIAHLYPSLLNVAGDGGNLIALQRRAQWRGIPVDVTAVEKGETPDFGKFDIVLFHGGQDVEMSVAAADFAHKAPSLRAAAEEGVLIFAVCAGLQLLGHRYISNAGEEMVGAGILDLETRGGPQRFMQHAACEVTLAGSTETVVGFENHSGLTELGPGCEAFGKVIAGAGNNGRDGIEGARAGNVFATYLHGPVLPKNPWLTDQLICIAVGRVEGVAAARVSLAPLDDALETRAHEVALTKAMANRGRRTALEPARLVRGQRVG